MWILSFERGRLGLKALPDGAARRAAGEPDGPAQPDPVAARSLSGDEMARLFEIPGKGRSPSATRPDRCTTALLVHRPQGKF